MNESNVPALIVVCTLIFIGVVLLFQRIGQTAKRRSDSVKAELRPSEPPSSPPGDRTKDERFIERLLSGTARRADEVATNSDAAPRDTEQTFRNMFFTTSDGGEGLIEYYMTRYQCDRTEAMRHAIREREREARD
jgi:hypothetical protein